MMKSLMVGLTEKDMQAVVSSYDLKQYYYSTLFPLKKQYTLTWKTLETKVGLRIAADLVARGTTLDAKTRNAVNRIMGDIPKLGIKRIKTEEELNEYDIMIAMTSDNPDTRALVEAWAEDTQFCWDGINARLEWMALYQISHGGKLKVTSENNAHVVSAYDADYSIDADQFFGCNTPWTTTASAKPFSKDFRGIVKAARAKSIHLKFAFLNQDTFNNLVETEECQKLCASYVQNALGLQTIPGITAVNSALANIPYLYGLQLRVIDQDITIELPDGTQSTGNPFADNVVLFTETEVLGNTFYKEPIDMKLQGSAAIKALNGPVCIKKFSNEEPVEEVTEAVANAIPAWSNSAYAYFLDTKNTTWNTGE